MVIAQVLIAVALVVVAIVMLVGWSEAAIAVREWG